MLSSIPFGAALMALVVPVLAGPLASDKRGLCFTPNITTPEDNSIWAQKPTDLTWYYNYGEFPSDAFDGVSQSDFEFVPMLWGAPSDVSNTTFLKSIKSLINDKGINITHVLSFNEPDGPAAWGGSDIKPEVAAQVWVNNMIPLQKMGIKVGLPATMSTPDGLQWLKDFLVECSGIISEGGNKKNCTYDFVPIHWYGDFGGLASHMGTYSATFPNKSIWITEYNFADQELGATQDFYNMSAEYFDRLDFVERYSLFGAFRSDVSNVGPNAAMLNKDGQLTDIGAWYLGREATGVDPQSGQGVQKKSAGLKLAMPQLGSALLGSVLVTGVLLGF